MKRCFAWGLSLLESRLLGTTSLRFESAGCKVVSLPVAYLLARVVSLFARKADLKEKLAKFSLVAHG
jgi:hypothetical protein